MNKGLKVVLKALEKTQKAILVASSIMIIVLVLLEVLFRYVFSKPIMGVEEIATLSGFWLYFVGAAWGTAQGGHIKADISAVFIQDPKKLAFLQTFVSLGCVVLAGIMAVWGWDYVAWGLFKMERSPVLRIPMVLSQGSIFVGAVLMTFYFFLEFLENARRAFRGEGASSTCGKEAASNGASCDLAG